MKISEKVHVSLPREDIYREGVKFEIIYSKIFR